MEEKCRYLVISIFIFLTLILSVDRLKNRLKIEERKSSSQKLFNAVTSQKNQNHASNEKSNWIIIGFSDIKYLPVARIWYKQLSSIGYTNHYIIALDSEVYQRCSSSKLNIRVKNATSYYKPNPLISRVANLNRIWTIRLKTIQKLLVEEGKNVLISDVDSIWVNYKDLEDLPKSINNRSIDAFHALGKFFPEEIYQQVGFVICGCLAGYRSTSNTLKLFQNILEKCRHQPCDDQILINNIYLNDYNMKWSKMIPGFENNLGVSENLTAMTFSPFDIRRGKNFQEYNDICGAKSREIVENEPRVADYLVSPWVLMPVAHKTVQQKIEMFRNVSECFQPGVI